MNDSTRHLDASGPREVVYCHQCDNEWYQDENGLTCPRCHGDITEIVSPETDPRPIHDDNSSHESPSLRDLHDHHPWGREGDSSDPEEADIEEHITRGPGNSIFISRTIRSGPQGFSGRPPRRPTRHGGDTEDLMNDFQHMLGNLMGGDFRPGAHGRSGPNDLYPGMGGGFRFGGNGTGPEVVGGRFTFTTGGNPHPRNPHDPQGVPDIPTLLGAMFGNMGPTPAEGHRGAGMPGMPQGLQGLFASLLNPANQRAGDAVYTQEALDQIISQLMEQHPTSNAPGPASPDAIAALPKLKLDEKLLGPEGKGECTVCMDDVAMGDEVVQLPCSHWFHEPCAAAWLSEHNTCPICRKGIEGDAAPDSPNSTRAQASGSQASNERPGFGARPHRSFRSNSDRLASIQRAAGRLSPTDENPGPRRYQVVGDGTGDFSSQMPGSFTPMRRRESESSGSRDSRRAHTSGSDRSRDSRRSSGSNAGGGDGSGPMNWFRQRFGSNSDRR